jgi:hypothetical protein
MFETTVNNGGRLRSWATLLALGALLASSWRACYATHQRRASRRSAAQARPLQTWEGEGGAVAPAE